MVVKMIKWRPWPPLQSSKKFEAKIVVHSLTGLDHNNDNKGGVFEDGFSELRVEIQWKGSKANGFKSFRKKSVKKDCTRVGNLVQNGVVQWDEEFKSFCGFYHQDNNNKVEGVFLPWDIQFLVFHGSRKQSKKKVALASPAVLNLADYAFVEDLKEFDINVPLSILRNGFKCSPSLSISLSLTELRTAQQVSEEAQRPVMFAPLSPCFGGPLPIEKDEGSSFKSSIRKVKSWTDYVSSRRMKKADRGEVSSDSKFSTGSEDSEYNYPFDTDSFDDSDEPESEESKEDTDVQNSCNYGPLMHANLRINCEDEDMVYYSKNKPDVDSSPSNGFGSEVSKQVPTQSPKFGILSWRKRKLSFRSPRVKGEPLLKKDYGEEGGDDIDFDRRQLSSDESTAQLEGSTRLISEFGDDNFAVGSWEVKEVLNRDGSMKLRTQVFFASIDQRSERAAGESACTALVAVIADWLHSNQGEIPIKSEFDSLIREGSLQWRNLCENETYRERFPDKHFDLETVLEAKIRPLSVVPERSFIGFFHPEGLEDEESFGFLHSSMSFDNIWDEICRVASEQNHNSEPLVYIVSWNDHFFILRVDSDAYYIIDTLGERLYEGCNQAFVLKFDRDTTIKRVLSQEKTTTDPPKEKLENSKPPQAEKSGSNSPDQGSETLTQEKSVEEMVVSQGKESCKEYIKSFLAAIPIRELQADMKKGLSASTLVHQRLQIEFNYTSAELEYVAQEKVANEELTLVATDFPAYNQMEAVFQEPDISVPVVAEEELAPMAIATDVPVPMLAVAVA